MPIMRKVGDCCPQAAISLVVSACAIAYQDLHGALLVIYIN